MKEIKIDGKPGDEIALVYGDKTLIVKIGEDAIIPDFVEAFDKSFDFYAYDLLNSASARYHRYREGKERLLLVLAAMRDKLFDTLNPAPVEEPEETNVEEPEQDAEPETDETEPVAEEESEPKKTTKKTSKK